MDASNRVGHRENRMARWSRHVPAYEVPQVRSLHGGGGFTEGDSSDCDDCCDVGDGDDCDGRFVLDCDANGDDKDLAVGRVTSVGSRKLRLWTGLEADEGNHKCLSDAPSSTLLRQQLPVSDIKISPLFVRSIVLGKDSLVSEEMPSEWPGAPLPERVYTLPSIVINLMA